MASLRVADYLESTGERIITLNDFKSALGISDKYPEFKELNRRVLKPVIEELNNKTDLSVTLQTINVQSHVYHLSLIKPITNNAFIKNFI